ncbi:hypothetical protein [Polynucleobacter sp. IMCC 29146]|uniref:hypothetical protein n=1 Tax=Polynucleobacter sp. IMCC 29146 TaxID=2780953 RepID=UPI001F3C0FEA|nr:hypothetical protein [Polynucleobacter sp. IMCC 29146]MCE7530413.1 hypothetical protein [Polynucleobacter sp. IMCC 29146]
MSLLLIQTYDLGPRFLLLGLVGGTDTVSPSVNIGSVGLTTFCVGTVNRPPICSAC